MQIPVLSSLILFAFVSSHAHEDKALKKRVQQLESELARINSAVAPLVDKAEHDKRVLKWREKARVRMRKDSAHYSREEIREIEKLYQVANRKWQTEEGKASLETLIEKFDKANRTGCALLYLGQMSKGATREDYLKRAIDGFSDCFYGDGVQVGAYARYYLSQYYSQKGNKEEAEQLLEEIKADYPGAIDHQGELLIP